MVHDKCSQGPTDLFPDTLQCPNPPTRYLFGDPYCDECYRALVEIHRKFSLPSISSPENPVQVLEPGEDPTQ